MEKIILENKSFRLTLREDSIAESLINKSNGEECLTESLRIPFFAAAQDRPYNNEIKLAYMNKRTVCKSNRVKLDGNRLTVGFELFPFEAEIDVTINDTYIAFTLVDFIAESKDYPMPMDFPPVTEFFLIELAVNKANAYGQWINVSHTEKSSVAVMSTSQYAFADTETFGDVRILKASARSGIKLRGCGAALIVSDRDKLLSAIDSLEEDYDLPRGAKSRMSDKLNASIYWIYHLNPQNVDEHIKYAKQGGFRLMLLYFTSMCKVGDSYLLCGDYDFNENYPNGFEDLKTVIGKIKAAGITPGLHFLHTHVSIGSKYVTPHADRRLHLKRMFTLSKPLGLDDDTVYVDQNPIDSPIYDARSRLLRFDGEIISYESYTSEPPFMFTGCKRGHFNTEITEHKEYTVGGVLDVSEFTGTSIYLDQDSDLQDELGDELAAIYNTGFEFIYFDGSEGTNAPFEFHVPNAQYRMYKKMNTPPIFCEGAAKAHFGWHMLSGGNAFDVFPTKIFKDMIIEHPFKEAKFMQNDLTRVNFGWWAFYLDTRPDVYEFGTSKAAAWNCPVTVMAGPDRFEENPRFADIFEVMRRWEDVRAKKWLTKEHLEMLRDEKKEHTLIINEKGEYELVEYEEIKLAPEATVSAFTFTRNEEVYAVVWDNKGESVMKLNQDLVISYTTDVGGEDIPYAKKCKKAHLPISRKAYIRASCDKEALIAAIRSATKK